MEILGMILYIYIYHGGELLPIVREGKVGVQREVDS